MPDRDMSWHSLLERQLGEAFPEGIPDLPELRAFLAQVSDAYSANEDEHHELEGTIQLANAELAERNFWLEQRVEQLIRMEQIMAERSNELDQRNRNMAVLLNNVAQGFATVDLDGTVRAECSQSFSRWFGAPTGDLPIWTMLASDDPNLAAWIQLGFDSLHSELMPLDVVLGQLPRRLERDGRQLRIEYQAIGVPLAAILVVASDVTDEVARQRAEAGQRELLAVLENAYRDRDGFLAFIQETNALLHDPPHALELGELKRRVHTLKGNAALFGVTSVSEICHDLETRLDDEALAPDAAAWGQLVDTWQRFHDRVDELLRVSHRRVILVDWDEYQSAVAAMADDRSPWAARVRRWSQDPTRPHLEHFAARAHQLARRLGRAELDIELRDNDVRVDRERFAPLWSALAHSVRNAVDHGIEATADRIARGKPARARLSLHTELCDGALVIEIRDDGNGIDWPAVAERAAAMGLPTATHRDLVDALFASGMSTASEVTQTSGRGEGMSAVRATCNELGGHIELTSEPGRGTTVRCSVPLARPTARPRSASLYQV